MPHGTAVRAAIVGAGLMGRWHAAAIADIYGRLVAVADRNEEAARRLAQRYPAAKWFSGIEELLTHASCDVVHVCTPAGSHAAIADVALWAGCHVVIEKPVTEDAADTEQLVQRAAQQGLLICPVHQFVFQDGVLRAKERLPRIGTVLHMEATISSAGGVGRGQECLDGIVADILPHPLSLMQVFLPDGLLPEAWMTVRPRPGELRSLAVTSGLSLSVSVSMHARPPDCAMRIFGTRGTIHLDLFHGYSFTEPGRVSKAQKVWRPFDLALRRLGAASVNLTYRSLRHEPAYPGLRRLVGRFYESVQRGGESPIAPDAILNLARVRDRLLHEHIKPWPQACVLS